MSGDKELIEDLGGATKLCELLGYDKRGGVQRVQNWKKRGIPAKVKLDHAEVFRRPKSDETACTPPRRRASDR